MKNLLGHLIIVLLTVFSTSTIYAEKINEVTLIVASDGASKEEAIKNALRSAVEQTFGAFVSTNTELLNDEIVKDEIATVSSGNIKKYDVLASSVLPSGNISVTVEAIVCVSKLISYSKSKGSACELDGESLAADLELQRLYMKNEEIGISNVLKQVETMLRNGFDYKVEVGDVNFSHEENSWFYGEGYGARKTEYNGDNVVLPFKVSARLNKTGKDAFYYLYAMIDQLAEKQPSQSELEIKQKKASDEVASYIKKEDKNIKAKFKKWKDENSESGRYDGVNKYQLYYEYLQHIWLPQNGATVRQIFAKYGLDENGYPLCMANYMNSWYYFLSTPELINQEIKSSRENMAKARGREPDKYMLFFKSENTRKLLDDFFSTQVNEILSNYELIAQCDESIPLNRNKNNEKFAISPYSMTNDHLPIIKDGSAFYFYTDNIGTSLDNLRKIRKIEVVKK